MNKHYRRQVMGYLTALLLVCAANAADDKVYTAIDCRVSNQSLEGGNSNEPYYTLDGGVYNASTTSTLVVTCPVIRDTIAAHLRGGNVIVVDENPNVNQEVRCRLCEREPWNEGNCVFSPTTSGSKPGWQQLGLPPVERIATPGAYTFAYLECRIPPAWNLPQLSGIFGYLIREQ